MTAAAMGVATSAPAAARTVLGPAPAPAHQAASSCAGVQHTCLETLCIKVRNPLRQGLFYDTS
jgi:hypothetical protein